MHFPHASSFDSANATLHRQRSSLQGPILSRVNHERSLEWNTLADDTHNWGHCVLQDKKVGCPTVVALDYVKVCSHIVTATDLSSLPAPYPTGDAQDHAESMSGPEPPERTSRGSPGAAHTPSRASAQDVPSKNGIEEVHMDRHLARAARRLSSNSARAMPPLDTVTREIPFAHMRIHFADFALQLRLRRHHEHRQRMLSHRRNRLQNAVALSARLHRVSSWVHDGLVEITQQVDASGFTRLHQHTHDLVDLCFSQWNHEIQQQDQSYIEKVSVKESFFSQLPQPSQQDCLDFIHTLRSNPRFLVERLKAMSAAQILSLSTSPKFQELSESVLTSLSQNRGRSSMKKRVKAYSKDLEDYASSFERSNPLSFLLHNIYGSFQGVQSSESKLRFATWSTICSSLMIESGQAFDAIVGPVLSIFAGLYEWQIKDRLELFLMSVLQRGAFLTDMLENSGASLQSPLAVSDTFNTPQAQEFFDGAVRELFEILSCDGGLPIGALNLGRAIIGKLPTLEVQSQFRGHLFFQWFLKHFLRITIAYPEVLGCPLLYRGS